MTVVLIGLAILVGVLLLVYGYGYWQATRLPENHPAQFLKAEAANRNGKVVVCIGDSITHGRASCDYVSMLRSRLGSRDYTFVNAGINGEHTYNVLQRLGDVIRCKPDVVTILIGTNDCNGSMDEYRTKRAIKEFKLPQPPSLDWYRANLTEICRRLKNETSARVTVLSIPVLTEDPQSPDFQASERFAAAGKEIAEVEGVHYIPLHERMVLYLEQHPSAAIEPFDMRRKLIERAVMRYFFGGQSWDAISKAYGFTLLTDFIHLNNTAGAMVADEIERFVAGDGSK